MKVRALIRFNDLQANKFRKTDEVFEVTPKRLEELNSSQRVLVKVIEEEVKPKQKATKKVGD